MILFSKLRTVRLQTVLRGTRRVSWLAIAVLTEDEALTPCVAVIGDYFEHMQ